MSSSFNVQCSHAILIRKRRNIFRIINHVKGNKNKKKTKEKGMASKEKEEKEEKVEELLRESHV